MCSCVLIAEGATYAQTPIAVALVVVAAALPLILLAPELLLVLAILAAPVGIGVFATADPGTIALSSLRLPAVVAGATFVLLRHRIPLGRFKRAVVVYSLLLAWLLIRTTDSPTKLQGLSYVAKTVVPVVAFLALVNLSRSKLHNVAALLLAITLAASLIADYAMLAVGYGRSTTDPTRFAGLAGSSPSTGVALSLLAVSALAYSGYSRSRAFFVLYVASFPILLLAYARIAITAWLLGSLVVLILTRVRPAAYVALLGGFVLVATSQTLADRSLNGATSGGWGAVITNVQSKGFTGINTTGRTEIWSHLWDSARHSLIIGSGPGTAEVLAKQVTSGNIHQAHSEYLGLLVDGGVIALGLWVGFLCLLGRALYFSGSIARTGIGVLFVYAVLAATDCPISDYAQGGMLVAVGLAALVSEEAIRTSRGVTGATG